MADKTLQKTQGRQLAESRKERDRRVFVPAVDIYETGDEIVLMAEMPGALEDSIDVTLDNDVLTLKGKTQNDAPEGYELVYGEFGSGDYERSFSINESIDMDRIEAEYKNGVLTVRLPKAEPAKAKKIEVKVN